MTSRGDAGSPPPPRAASSLEPSSRRRRSNHRRGIVARTIVPRLSARASLADVGSSPSSVARCPESRTGRGRRRSSSASASTSASARERDERGGCTASASARARENRCRRGRDAPLPASCFASFPFGSRALAPGQRLTLSGWRPRRPARGTSAPGRARSSCGRSRCGSSSSGGSSSSSHENAQKTWRRAAVTRTPTSRRSRSRGRMCTGNQRAAQGAGCTGRIPALFFLFYFIFLYTRACF